jgi:transcription elongation factor Elf1
MSGVSAGHGENFPHRFYKCPVCNQKGIYVCSDKLGMMLRCRYCKQEKFIEVGTALGSIETELLFFASKEKNNDRID